MNCRGRILVVVCSGVLIVSICMGSVFQMVNAVPSFGSDVRVDSNTNDQKLPSVAVFDPGCAGCQPIIHAVWEDYRDGNWNIYYAGSEDGGKTFGTPMRVNDDTTGTQYPQSQPDVAADYDGNVHVVWADERNPLWNDKSNIYYAKLSFGASSFGTNTLVSDDGSIAPIHNGDIMIHTEPSITVDYQSTCRVHVSWYLYETGPYGSYIHGVIYDRNTNCGSGSFGTDQRLNMDGYSPSIAVDSSDNPHIAYVDGSSKIKHVKSSNGGSSFGSATTVTDAQSTYAYEPTIAIYPDPSDDIHVAWKDHRNVLSNYNYDIYYAKSTNGGTSFGTNVNVISGDLNNRGQGMPSIGVDEIGNPHIAWTDYRDDDDGWWLSDGGQDSKNNADIYYAESTNGGASFGTNMRVNDDQVTGHDKEQSYPAIAVTGGIATSEIVHIVWQDERNTNFDIYYDRYVPDPDIYYRVRAWGWQTEIEISTDTGTEEQSSYTPGGFAVAVNGDKVHVVWGDEGGGDWDVYYRYYDGTSWQTEQEISSGSGNDQRFPSIAVNGDKVHVVWEDDGGQGIPDHIYYRHYDGQSWKSQVKVSQGGISNWYPSVAVDGDEVHVAWQSYRSTDHDIYYRHYDGTTWENEEEISTDSGTEPQGDASIAADNNKVHVVWGDTEDGDIDIFYRKHDGTQWGTEQEVSTDTGTENERKAKIAVNGNNVHVVWMEGGTDYDIFYRHHDGSQWKTEKEISIDALAEDQYYPSVAVDGNKVHVVWTDKGDGDYDIIYREYDGSSWQAEQEISTDAGTETQTTPSIAVGNELHVVWTDGGDGDGDIYYRATGLWQQEQEISIDSTNEWQFHPSIAVNGDKVHIVWADWGDGDADIKYRYYDGSSWQTEMEISLDTGTEWQVQPSIAVDGTKIHVVWADKGDGDYDILYRYYDGSSWQTEVEISSDTGTEWQCQPTIAVDSGKVHVAWIDKGDGDWDIRYRNHDGSSWQTEVEISSDTGTEWQMDPSIVADGTKVHVVWADKGDGDWDIRYRNHDGSSWQTEQGISSDSGTEDQGRPSIAADSGKVHVVWDDFGDSDWDIRYRNHDGSSWQTELEISTDSGTEDQWDPSIAVEGTKIHVAWTDKGDGDTDIYYREFDGSSWLTELEISTDSGTEEQYSPEIAVDNDEVHFVWEDWQS